MPDNMTAMLNALDRIAALKGTLPTDDRETVSRARAWIATEIAKSKPRVLIVRELLALPFGAVVWEENRYIHDTPLEQMLDTQTEDFDVLQPMMRDDSKELPRLVNVDGYGIRISESMINPNYTTGFQMRYWSAKPSEQERLETPWTR